MSEISLIWCIIAFRKIRIQICDNVQGTIGNAKERKLTSIQRVPNINNFSLKLNRKTGTMFITPAIL